MQNDALNNLIVVKKRIDGQRTELTNELKRLEAEKEKIVAGYNEKPSGFTLADALNSNKTETIEEINRKITNIKKVLALPYYADSEYRKLSIAYMEEMTAYYAEKLKIKDTEIEEAENAIAEAEEHLEEVREQRENISSAVYGELSRVGLAGIISTSYTPKYMLDKYKLICSKYN